MLMFDYADGDIVKNSLAAISQNKKFSIMVRGRSGKKVKKVVDSFKYYKSYEYRRRPWLKLYLFVCWYRYISAFEIFQIILNADAARMGFTYMEADSYLRVDFSQYEALEQNCLTN